MKETNAEMQRKKYYDEELLEAAVANLKTVSPHTAAILRDPIHAYLCDGRCNEEDAEENRRILLKLALGGNFSAPADKQRKRS